MSRTELKALDAAERKAWRAACRSGAGLDDPEWQAAADALRHAEQSEEEWVSPTRQVAA